MSRLYMMVTITDRNRKKKFEEFYKKNEHMVFFTTLGRGTANSEMLDYFEVVGFEIHEDSINVRLDERDRIHKKRSGHTYVKNGFLPESLITDFPIRDKRATLIVRRRRWKDEETGEIVSNDYELVAKGTRHSKELAAFLKEVLGSIPDSGFFV